jgi:uncharacterized radical SAM superfamily protein
MSMEDNRQILEHFLTCYRQGIFTWADARHFLSIRDPSNFEWFFHEVAQIRFNKQPKILKCYIPGQHFPAISVTGEECELECEHCNKRYLHNMLQAPTEEQFRQILKSLVNKGAIGALLSGGSTKDGKVPLLKYKDIIDDFTDCHPDFYLNSHVGLVDFSEALQLKIAGIRTVSFDLVMDPRIIHDVFHMQDDPSDYLLTYENLKEVYLDVVPHVLVGGYFGKVDREIDILKMLVPNAPRLIVFIAMIPPKTSDGQIKPSFSQLTAIDIAKLIFIAKAMIPEAELSLGCMRPKGKQTEEIERLAILAGANRIEIPSVTTKQWAINFGFTLEYYGACCAIMPKFESKAKLETY